MSARLSRALSLFSRRAYSAPVAPRLAASSGFAGAGLVAASVAAFSLASPSSAAAAAAGAAQGAAAGADPVGTVVVYQYEACPFCNKLRAYLDYTRTPYVLVEVDPVLKRELAWSEDYKKVPVAIVRGRRVTDSARIIATLEAARARPVGDGSAQEAAFLAWADERWVRLLTVNIYRSQAESLQAFDYMTRRNFAPWAATAAKWFGAVVHAHVIQGRLKAKLGVQDERAALFAAADEWAAALGGRDFLGGAAPNLADLSVFGTLRAIDGLDASRDLLAARPGEFAAWVARMRTRVGESALVHRVCEKAVVPG
jgi:microsomal prostaglandin-E synthase 2